MKVISLSIIQRLKHNIVLDMPSFWTKIFGAQPHLSEFLLKLVASFSWINFQLRCTFAQKDFLDIDFQSKWDISSLTVCLKG